MANTPDNAHFRAPVEVAGDETTTAGRATSPHRQRLGETGLSAPSPSAQQIEDLNFYLRRMTIGGNGGGGTDYEMFLEAVGSIGIRYGWSKAEMVRTVALKLKDKAREYYGALLPAERPRSMAEMKQWFRRVFGRKLNLHAGKRELERCIRAPGEPLGEFAQRLKVIANKMFPASVLTTAEKLYFRNQMLVNQFVEGFDRRLANEILRAGESHNLEDCLDVAEDCEDIVSRMIPETRHDIIRRMEATTEEGVHTGISDSSNGQMYNPRHEAPKQNSDFGEGGRRNRNQPTSLPGDRPGFRDQHRTSRSAANRTSRILQKFPYMRNRCVRCGQEGHAARGCQQRRVLFCYHCGRIGEICALNSPRQRTQTSS